MILAIGLPFVSCLLKDAFFSKRIFYPIFELFLGFALIDAGQHVWFGLLLRRPYLISP